MIAGKRIEMMITVLQILYLYCNGRWYRVSGLAQRTAVVGPCLGGQLLMRLLWQNWKLGGAASSVVLQGLRLHICILIGCILKAEFLCFIYLAYLIALE